MAEGQAKLSPIPVGVIQGMEQFTEPRRAMLMYFRPKRRAVSGTTMIAELGVRYGASAATIRWGAQEKLLESDDAPPEVKWGELKSDEILAMRWRLTPEGREAVETLRSRMSQS